MKKQPFTDELENHLLKINHNRNTTQGKYGCQKDPLGNNLYSITITGFEKNKATRTLKYTAVIKFVELDVCYFKVEKLRNEFVDHPYINNNIVEISSEKYTKLDVNYCLIEKYIRWLDEYHIQPL